MNGRGRVRSEAARIFEIVAAMEDDLHGLKDGTDTLIAVAAAHGLKDVGWCSEHLRRHADAVHARWRSLFAESAAARRG